MTPTDLPTRSHLSESPVHQEGPRGVADHGVSSSTAAQGSTRRSFFSVRTWQNHLAQPQYPYVFTFKR